LYRKRTLSEAVANSKGKDKIKEDRRKSSYQSQQKAHRVYSDELSNISVNENYCYESDGVMVDQAFACCASLNELLNSNRSGAQKYNPEEPDDNFIKLDQDIVQQIVESNEAPGLNFPQELE